MEKNKDALTKLVESQLFKGEELKYQLGNVKLKTEFHGETAGRLFITNYQCLFVEDEIPHHFTSVHLHAIHRVKKTSKSKAPDGTGGVDIVCKDFRRVTLRLPNTPRGSRKAVVEELTKYAFPPLSRLFAYSLEEDLGETNGWKLYDAEQEYARLGLDRDNWRLTTINDGHKFADTYPEKISIPASITDDKMKEAAKFRTHCRMIATVWKHPKNNATISRSSQPRRGLTGRRSQPDENLLDTIQKLNANTDTMYILDSRPKLNATANALTGGGYESTKSYLNTIREFAKIENIHDMRYSAKKLFRVCEKFTTDLVKNQPKNLTNTANTTDNTTNVEGNADNQTGGASNWWAELQATKYLDHIRAILAAANRLTELLDKEQASVLVHCSDGWDRTAQMTALGELMLDPYYRTISGFAQLVEKEWASFGHRFAIRGGHDVNMGNFKDKERSPVFLQFIDCVWQLTEQYPVDFEFNSHFLVTIMDHFFDSLFGTFLGNCDLERKKLKVPEKTVSMWTLVLNNPDIFANKNYSPENHVLYANVSKAKIRLWESFYLRWRVLDLHGVVLSLEDNLKSYNLGINKYWSEKYRTTIGDEVPMIILGDESHPDGQDDELIRVESSANLKNGLSPKRVTAPNERPRMGTTMGDDSEDGTRSADNSESESDSSDSSDRQPKKKNAVSGASSPAQSPTGRGGKNRSQSTMDPPANRTATEAKLRTSDTGVSPRGKTPNNSNNTNSVTNDNTSQDTPTIVIESENKTNN